MLSAATKWACAEMLLSGTTTFYDILEAQILCGWARHPKDEVVCRDQRDSEFEATERSGKIGKLGIQENLSFHEKTQDDPLISAMMCLHTTYLFTKIHLRSIFSSEAELELAVTHIATKENMKVYGEETMGRTSNYTRI